LSVVVVLDVLVVVVTAGPVPAALQARGSHGCSAWSVELGAVKSGSVAIPGGS
jgi:hypothetical protein